MITRFARLTSRLLVAVAILFTITACGGGGGGSGFLPDDGSGSGTYFVSVQLLDSAGNKTNTVTSSAPTTLRVTITKNGPNGAPIADVVVTVGTDTGTITPDSGTALTDSAGIANFRIEAGGARGAGTITASVDSPAGTVTGSFPFQIGGPGLRLGYFDDDGMFVESQIDIEPDSLLASQAVAQLSLAIVDQNGDLASSAESVSLSSGCLASGQASIDPNSPIITGNGLITTAYTASGCSGNDQITASLEGSSAQAFGTLSIAPPQANGLTFVSAEPSTIVLRGTGGGGGRSESSTVTFLVVNSIGVPLGGISVDFSLTTSVGGISLSPPSAVSGSDGLVRVNVFSGDIPTPVRVIATAVAGDGSGQQVSTVSDVLTISTGLPDQDSMTLSVSEGGFVIENGFTMVGIRRTITVSMSDKYNNPVPNGTAASFRTEYGTIDPSCQTGIANGERLAGTPVEGTCSVLWTSGNPRYPNLSGTQFIQTIYDEDYNCPSHNANSGPCPVDLGYTRGGRSTILVTAIGEESFTDRNGNGIMDQNEQDLFINLPEAWLDENEDGFWTPGLEACSGSGSGTPQCIAGQEEEPIDYNGNLMYDLNNDPAVFNGLVCPLDGDGVWCSRELVNVRAELVLILSAAPEWDIALYRNNGRTPVTGASASGGVYTAYVSDIYNNRPPEGSTVALTSDVCTLTPANFTVSNTDAYGAFALDFQVSGEGDPGTMNITLNPAGSGTPYTETFACTPNAPVDCDFSPTPPGCPDP